MSQNKANRRHFLKTTAAVGVGYWAAGGVVAKESTSANERIRFASVGIGGKGSSDSGDAGNSGDMVAICDIDEGRLNAAGKSRFKGAQKFTDFRKMLDKMHKSIDAVTVSTPDHTHAPAALMAMRLGKACFCQKPLTHSLYEARLMAKTAREQNVATQMGNQGTAQNGLREASTMIRNGLLGDVSEVHVWTNRPIWPQGGARPAPADCPSHINWNGFIAAAPYRPFANGYHPFSWRGWWDFGTGALGDMACHTVNMPFNALRMADPTSIEATTSGHNKDSYPKWSIIKFQFPSTKTRPGFKFTWYDGGKRPPRELLDGKNPPGSGCVVIGSKGKIFSPDDYGARYTVMGPAKDNLAAAKEKAEFTRSPGHFKEWVEAIKSDNKKPAMSNFADYSGALTETILLGNLAVWASYKPETSTTIEWDAKNLKATNLTGAVAAEVELIVKPQYRQGYTLDV